MRDCGISPIVCTTLEVGRSLTVGLKRSSMHKGTESREVRRTSQFSSLTP
jgi:hypothetical protein